MRSLSSCLIFLLTVQNGFTRENQSSRKMDHRFRRELIIADGLKSAVDLIMSRMKTLKEETGLEMEMHAEDMLTIMRNFEEVMDFQVCNPNRTELVYTKICNCVENKPVFPNYNNDTFSLSQKRFREWSQNYDSLSSDANKTRDHIKMMHVEFRKSEKVCKNIVDPVRKEECTWEINKRANKTFEDIKGVQDKASRVILEVKEVLERFVDEIFQHKTSQINDIMAKIESYVCCLDRIGLRVQNYECENGNNTQFFKYNRTIAAELEEMKLFLKHDYNTTRILSDTLGTEDSDDVNDQFDIEARKKFEASVSDDLVPRHRRKYYGVEIKRSDSWVTKEPIRTVFTDGQNEELLQATSVKKRETELTEKTFENDDPTEITTEMPVTKQQVNTSRNVSLLNVQEHELLKENHNQNNTTENLKELKEITTTKSADELTTASPKFKTSEVHLEKENAEKKTATLSKANDDENKTKNYVTEEPAQMKTLKTTERSTLNTEDNSSQEVKSSVTEHVELSKENQVTTLETTSSVLATEITTLECTSAMEMLQPQVNVPTEEKEVSQTETNRALVLEESSRIVTNIHTTEETSTFQDLFKSTLYPQTQHTTNASESTDDLTPMTNLNEETEFKTTSLNLTTQQLETNQPETNQPDTKKVEYAANNTKPNESP